MAGQLLNIVTSRLDLVPATLALLSAELESRSTFASVLGALVPDEWPPGEYDRPAIEHFRSRLIERPDDAGWSVWYALLRSGGLEAASVVGAGGFFGPPNAEGVVEIGYSIMPAFTGRGYATELVRALVEHAFQSGRVTRVVAHTTRDNIGSVRVLEKAGFGFVGPGQEVGTIEYGLKSPET